MLVADVSGILATQICVLFHLYIRHIHPVGAKVTFDDYTDR